MEIRKSDTVLHKDFFELKIKPLLQEAGFEASLNPYGDLVVFRTGKFFRKFAVVDDISICSIKGLAENSSCSVIVTYKAQKDLALGVCSLLEKAGFGKFTIVEDY